MLEQIAKPETLAKRRSASQWAVAWRRFTRNKAGVAGLIIVSCVVFVGVFGGFLAHYPARPDPGAFPGWETGEVRSPPSWKYPFGTTGLGTDVLSDVIHGTKYSLYVGVIVTIMTLLISIIVGAIAGFYGGWVDNVLMRITEVFLVFPSLLFILVLVRVFTLTAPDPYWIVPLLNVQIPAGLTIVVFVLAVFNWSSNARMIRGEFLRIREMEFVEAERALGASNMRIIFRHILPNLMSSIIVIASLTIAYAILVEAGVSFLGFGDPNTNTWGLMLQEGYQGVATVWWAEVFPGLAILATVLGFNLLGDGLADAFNPRLRD